jgi:sugar (pentulose or hexulose) kinase
MRIFADVFGLPAKRNLINGAAGLGSAICAAVAVNAYRGFDDAVKHMVKIRDTFTPDTGNTAIYHQMNTVYKNITAHTDPILQLSYPIFK